MSKYTAKEFRREAHHTFETIGESYPNGEILDHSHFGNSPVSSHHPNRLACAATCPASELTKVFRLVMFDKSV